MRTNFSSKLISAASALFVHQAYAALPRHCFIPTELHGPLADVIDQTVILSDLPTLMGMMQPNMRLSAVESITDNFIDGVDYFVDDIDGEEMLSGLRLKLFDPTEQKELELTQIASDMTGYKTAVKEITQPLDKITLLWDEVGICDVRMYGGSHIWTMLERPVDCRPGQEGIEEYSLSMTESFPLVGLHGRVDDVGIVALGFIMLDVFTDECRHDTKTNPDL